MENGIRHKRSTDIISSFYIVLITLGLPLIMDNGFYNITVTKSRYYYAVTSAFIVVAAVCIFIGNKGFSLPKKLRIGALDITMAVYLAAVILSSLLSEYDDVWLGDRSRYQGAVTVILYVATYFLLSRYYESTVWLLTGCIISLAAVSVIGVMNCFGVDFLGFYEILPIDDKRIYISTIGNANFYSSFICLMLPFTVCGFCSVRGKVSRIIYTAALIAGSLGTMVTASESFAVSFAAVMVIIPILLIRDVYQIKRFLMAVIIMIVTSDIYALAYGSGYKKGIRISKLIHILVNPAVSFLIIAVCLAVLLILNKNPQKINMLKKVYCAAIAGSVLIMVCLVITANVHSLGVLDEFLRFDAEWGNTRGAIWKQCMEIYRDFSLKEKLFGIGPEVLYRVTKALNESDNMKLDQAHNEYLQYLLTVGIFGLMSYLAVIISVCYTVLKHLRENAMAVALLSGLVCFWIQASVNMAQPFTTPLMYIFISVTGAIYHKEKRKSEPFIERRP